MQKKFLTTDEITHGYGLDAATVQALVDSGDLKALADRGTWKYRKDDIEALIKSGHLHPTKELPVVDDLELDESFALASDDPASSAADFIELDEDALSEQPTMIRGESALDDDGVGGGESESDVHIIFEPTAGATFSDSDIRLGGADLLAARAPQDLGGDDSDSDVRTAPSSGELRFPEASKTEEIEIDELDESDQLDVIDRMADDHVGSQETLSDLATDWSDSAVGEAFAQPQEDDSGIALDADDSGISLDPDSGITIEAGDSGIALDLGDSGISLDAGDSGIALDVGESGIKLAGSAPTQAELSDPLAKTENQIDFGLADEDVQRTVIDKMDQTAVIASMDDSSEFAPTLSGAIAAGGSVEDLDISPDLDEVVAEDEEFESAELEDEEEIHEVDDEAFSDEFSEAGDDEELAAAPGKAKSYEPGWGTPTFVLALSAALVVGINVWLAWSGLQTMWDGSEPAGPASSLVSTIGGLM